MKRNNKIGLHPGAIVFTGNRKVEMVNLHYLCYSEHSISETQLDNHSEIQFHNNADQVDWYDIRGIHDVSLIAAIGESFEIEPLVLADIVDPIQRSTFQEYLSGIFLIIKSITFDKESKKIYSEHLGLYFSSEYLISFQEDHTDVFNLVRKRVQSNKGIVRSRQADYLAFALIDSILEQNFLVVDDIQSEIQLLEDQILDGADSQFRQKLHFLKKEILRMHRLVAPLRETLSRLSRSNNDYLDPKNSIYFRDLHDTVIQILDRLEGQRDYLNGLQDLHLSEISFKMNEIMKVLTIITTIFVPLSFLTGLYGMNFENIPELRNQNGYFFLVGVMAIVVTGLLIFFKRRKWL